jgi:hypothetical protein
MIKQKAYNNDRVILGTKALRRYREIVGNKTGIVIDVDYQLAMERYLYTVSFPGYDVYYLWSYEFNKVK